MACADHPRVRAVRDGECSGSGGHGGRVRKKGKCVHSWSHVMMVSGA
jgi:hypothetical protein